MPTNTVIKSINSSVSVSPRLFSEAFTIGINEPVGFVNRVVSEAVKLGASDILFEPQPDEIRLRIRIDGVLYLVSSIPTLVYPHLSSRIKVMGKLDSMEKRKIQEGQFTLEHEGSITNLRVEIVQTIHGEFIVIRIHEKQTIVMNLSRLGFNEQADRAYRDMLKSSSGLILISGPTGSGKTTTLYSTIEHMNADQKFNVMTIEDPIEYQLTGINQMQTREEVGFTFAEGLRTILRLTPDIIFVGEIRDKETAKITIESGLTGQLVLSSIHAPDAVGTLYRLLDLGIETYVLNSALLGLVSQRLVRKTCQYCLEPCEATKDELNFFQKTMGRPPQNLRHGKGCQLCQNIGYKGRLGIYEVLPFTAKLRDKIREELSEDALRQKLVDEGFINMIKDGLLKSEQGITTISEIMRTSLRY